MVRAGGRRRPASAYSSATPTGRHDAYDPAPVFIGKGLSKP